MKLRNKKTGRVIEWFNNTDDILPNSLAELNEEWEDMPEEEWRDVLGFEELYQVSNFGNVRTVKNGEAEMSQQENRNGYMTVHLRNKGVERRAIEKLKAWKRLKDRGFKFEGLTYSTWDAPCVEYTVEGDYLNSDVQVEKDLDLLFGGKKTQKGRVVSYN